MATTQDLLQALQVLKQQTASSDTSNNSAPILQQYAGGQALVQQQSAAEQAAAEQKAREAKAKADKAEADALASQKATGYNANDFFMNTLGYSPETIMSSALTDNGPDSWGNIPSAEDATNAFGSAPTDNTTALTQAQTQPQQTSSGFDIPADIQQYMPTGANAGATNLTNAAQAQVPDQTLIEDPRKRPDWDKLDYSERFRLLKQARDKEDFLKTYAFDDQGKIYKKNSNAAIHWDASTKKGRDLLAQANTYGLTPPGAVQAAGNTVQAQAQQNAAGNQQQGVLTNSAVAPDATVSGPNDATYKAPPEELEGIMAIDAAAQAGTVGKPELDNLFNSIVSVKNNALEKLNSQAALLGGAQNLEYAITHPNAGANQVAEDLVKGWGLDGKSTANIARKIQKLANDYKNVPPAAIGAILKTYSRNSSDAEGLENFYFDTTLAGNMEYLDTDVKNALSELNDKSKSGNYELIKDSYNRTKRMMSKLADVQTAIQMSEKSYNELLNDYQHFGKSPKSRLHQSWIDKDSSDTNTYAANAAKKALEAFKELGSYYNAFDRVQYVKDNSSQKTSKSQTNTTQTTQANTTASPSSNPYMEKAAGFGLYK